MLKTKTIDIRELKSPWTLAATSWLWPLPIAENLERMANWDLPIRQAALLFYESDPSLDLEPRDLPGLPGLTTHAHLPVDLPWNKGAKKVWKILTRLMDKVDRLGAWAGVLHPPADPEVMAEVAAMWKKAAPPWRLLLENVPGQDLSAHWPMIKDLDLPLCLDFGHMWAFGQHWLLKDPEVLPRVELLHCYAPGDTPNRHKHLSLAELTPEQTLSLRRILAQLPRRVVILFEVFAISDLRTSLEAFYHLTDDLEVRP